MPLPDAPLRQRVRMLMEQGKLPAVASVEAWGGEGSGDRCAACAQVIGPEDIEYEISQGRSTYRFHLRCHSLWQEECARKSSIPPSA